MHYFCTRNVTPLFIAGIRRDSSLLLLCSLHSTTKNSQTTKQLLRMQQERRKFLYGFSSYVISTNSLNILKHAWFNKAPLPIASMGLTKASNASANQQLQAPAPVGKSVKILEATHSSEEPVTKSTRSSIFGLFSSSSAKPHDSSTSSKESGKHRTSTGPSSSTAAAATALLSAAESKSK